MSQENVEIVRRAFEAFNSSDFEAAARAFHPDIEFVRAGGQAPVRGVAALREWMKPEAFEDQRFELLDLTVNGNKILVGLRFTSRGAASGLPLETAPFAVYTMDDGLITRLEAFLPHEQIDALKAAGLSE